MSKRTQKAKSVGRFGARYGVKIRRRIREVEIRQRAKHTCPQCGAQKVQRESTAIWVCRKCDYKFAGGAYVPHTPSYRSTERVLRDIMAEQASRRKTTEAAPAEE